jgi:hypothetical protein
VTPETYQPNTSPTNRARPRADLPLELQILSSNAVLRGHPSGDERWANCRYYLDETADLSYCWHPKIRILVGDNWWCQWWEEAPEP